MTIWTKVQRGATHAGKPPRTTPAVQRARTGFQAAKLTFPSGMFGPASHVNVYADAEGSKLAFRFGNAGTFKVSSAGKRLSTAPVPAAYAKSIPFGTTDVELTAYGDMWVLDLRSIGSNSLAAE